MNENNNETLKDEVKNTEASEVLESYEKTEPAEEANEAFDDSEKEKEDASVNEATFAFEWKYADEISGAEKNKKKKKSPQKGALVYALVMCAAFLVAFAILAASLSFEDLAGAHKVPDRELSVTEIVEKGMPSSVLIVAAKSENTASSGSGFVVNDCGYIVTNYHVVEESLQIVVFDSEYNQYYAEIVNTDPQMDLALLYAEGLYAPSATLADSNSAKMGELVVAIGCPVGSGESLSVSDGIISGFDRSIGLTNVGMIQTNAPLNPGNSGGPLFDSRGNVVGIVTAKMSYDVDLDGEKIPLDGIAYAIPINEAKESITEWIATDLEKPMLGIHAVSVEEGNSYFYCAADGIIYGYENELGKKYRINAYGERFELSKAELEDPDNIVLINTKATGLLVVKITRGLGAYGKLERGDILVELNGEKTANTTEVRAIFGTLSVGEDVEVKIYRNGEPMTLKMTLKTKGDMLAAEKKGD